MMGISPRYKNTLVTMDEETVSPSLANRLKESFYKITTRLPDEEQFEMQGYVNFLTKQHAIDYWDMMNPRIGTSTDFRHYNKDGNCTHIMNEKIDFSRFYITIIIDDLESKSDNYIKGLIAHELSEMSYTWRALQNEKKNLKKLKPKAVQVRMDQITKQNSTIGTKDHQEHENNVDNEARRLGFSEEIDALNS